MSALTYQLTLTGNCLVFISRYIFRHRLELILISVAESGVGSVGFTYTLNLFSFIIISCEARMSLCSFPLPLLPTHNELCHNMIIETIIWYILWCSDWLVLWLFDSRPKNLSSQISSFYFVELVGWRGIFSIYLVFHTRITFILWKRGFDYDSVDEFITALPSW